MNELHFSSLIHGTSALIEFPASTPARPGISSRDVEPDADVRLGGSDLDVAVERLRMEQLDGGADGAASRQLRVMIARA